MPIQEADPWRLQYFENADCPTDLDIPTDDEDAWTWYSGHSAPLFEFLYLGVANHPFQLPRVGLKEAGELRRRAGDRIHAERGHPLAQFRLVHHLGDSGLDLV
jgi:hypothetical protein